jgi:ABC-2 type transport system ATP-binding protein
MNDKLDMEFDLGQFGTVANNEINDDMPLDIPKKDIGSIIKKPTRTLSLGQRMRCEIAIAFLHKPQIVFLDEPTIGLDSVSKLAVRKFIKEINKEYGTTIILTTHDTGDIRALAKRIILVGKGKILMDGSMKELVDLAKKQDISMDEAVAKLYKEYEIE